VRLFCFGDVVQSDSDEDLCRATSAALNIRPNRKRKRPSGITRATAWLRNVEDNLASQHYGLCSPPSLEYVAQNHVEQIIARRNSVRPSVCLSVRLSTALIRFEVSKNMACTTQHDVVVPTMTLWYPSLNPVVGRFDTNYKLNMDKSTTTSHFGFIVRYHNVLLMGPD